MEHLAPTLLASLSYLPAAERKEVERAVMMARQWHEGQVRESGEPYAIHPLSVALTLSQLEAGGSTLVAALLHDVIEDGRVDDGTIRREFGDEVARLVDGMTKLAKLQYEGDPSLRQVQSLRKMMLTASEDMRVIVIKLADRLHNVQTLSSLRKDKQQRIARETLDIYVPFARIVGLWDVKRELEEICFSLAYPEESSTWHEAIVQARAKLQPERERFVRDLNALTPKKVHPRLILMTDYEVFQRLFGDLSRLAQTDQLDSVSVVVNRPSSKEDCYHVLGTIHTHYPVHALTFRDFINAPQPSGYQALHTTIFLSRNQEVRLRIQTEDMFDFATRRKIPAWIDQKHSDVYAALSSLNNSGFDRDRYITDLKETVLDRMNVFTTAGEIIRLPRGAAGVDFAFLVNPDYLFSLAGVRVNGELHEATYELHDGDTAELALLDEGKTERRVMWVEKVKSAETRESLRQSLGQRPAEDRRNEGRSLLQYEVQKWKLPLWWLFHWHPTQQHIASLVQEGSFDDVLEKIGGGQLSLATVVEAYKSTLDRSPSRTQWLLQKLRLLPESRVLNKQASVIDIDIYAVDTPGMIYSISRCFAERGINISKFSVFALPPKDALYQIRLEVETFKQFSDLYDALLQVPNVKTIRRRK
ncbi:MAG: HD domain-containing protein [Candidatus Peribacteraceae bacterium]|nr:HD domain-containing protein [Candidatus Peribacteraceae bacterium]